MTEYRVYRLVHFILGGPDLDPPRKEVQLTTQDCKAAINLARTYGWSVESREVTPWRKVMF